MSRSSQGWFCLTRRTRLSKNSNPSAPPVDLGALLESSGAILQGHFLLTSGRHSAVYFEKFRILEQPAILSALVVQLIGKLGGLQIDVVAGPTTGGIIIAFEVARQLGKPALYVETENGSRQLRRGASVKAGSRVLIVDDVLTTGRSISEVRDVLNSAQAEFAAVGVLIDRSGGNVDFGVPFEAAYKVEAETYADHEVPDWLACILITKPGTRVEPMD